MAIERNSGRITWFDSKVRFCARARKSDKGVQPFWWLRDSCVIRLACENVGRHPAQKHQHTHTRAHCAHNVRPPPSCDP